MTVHAKQRVVGHAVEGLIAKTIKEIGHAIGWIEDWVDEGKAGCDDCEIPQTQCPDRCVGELRFNCARGAVPRAAVTVVNTGIQARDFVFEVTTLSGVGVGSAAWSVSPSSKVLAPGERVVVQLSLQDSATLTPSQSYHAELNFTGSWRQCVKLNLRVCADPSDTLALHQHDGQEAKSLHRMVHDRTLRWSVERGVVPQASISLRNAGRSAESFAVEPGPLAGVDGDQGRLTVFPDALALEPGQGGVIQVRLLDTNKLSPEQDYSADILIRGHQNQRVRVRCFIKPDPTDLLEVEQGELPTRIVAHNWYDHFQCTEACVNPSLLPQR